VLDVQPLVILFYNCSTFVNGNISVTYRMPAMFALRKGFFVTVAFAVSLQYEKGSTRQLSRSMQALFFVVILASRIKISLPARRPAHAAAGAAKKAS
jgi:hypothetical protein